MRGRKKESSVNPMNVSMNVSTPIVVARTVCCAIGVGVPILGRRFPNAVRRMPFAGRVDLVAIVTFWLAHVILKMLDASPDVAGIPLFAFAGTGAVLIARGVLRSNQTKDPSPLMALKPYRVERLTTVKLRCATCQRTLDDGDIVAHRGDGIEMSHAGCVCVGFRCDRCGRESPDTDPCGTPTAPAEATSPHGWKLDEKLTTESPDESTQKNQETQETAR